MARVLKESGSSGGGVGQRDGWKGGAEGGISYVVS